MKKEITCKVTERDCIHAGKDHLKKCTECRFRGPSFGYIYIPGKKDRK